MSTESCIRKKLIRYIYEHINDIDIEKKINILNDIAVNYGQDVIDESNDGCYIMFNHLDTKFLKDIKKIIDEDLDKYRINF